MNRQRWARPAAPPEGRRLPAPKRKNASEQERRRFPPDAPVPSIGDGGAFARRRARRCQRVARTGLSLLKAHCRLPQRALPALIIIALNIPGASDRSIGRGPRVFLCQCSMWNNEKALGRTPGRRRKKYSQRGRSGLPPAKGDEQQRRELGGNRRRGQGKGTPRQQVGKAAGPGIKPGKKQADLQRKDLLTKVK